MNTRQLAEEKSVEEFLDEISKSPESSALVMSRKPSSKYRSDVEARGLTEAVNMLRTLVKDRVRSTLLNGHQQALIKEVLKEAINVDERSSLVAERYELGKINKTQIMTAANYLNFL